MWWKWKGPTLDPKIEKDAKAKGLEYYEKKTQKKGADARVTNFGCHIQVDIIEDGKVILSLTYRQGEVQEILGIPAKRQKGDCSMKACPKCQTKNQESNAFCKKCGVKFSGTQFQDKKEKVLGEKKKSSRTMILLVLVAVGAGRTRLWIIQGSTPANSGVLPNPRVRETWTIRADRSAMTDVQSSVKNGENFYPPRNGP